MNSSSSNRSKVLLETSGLSVSYGRHQALVNASLHVCEGEIVVILGANGAGKTTLLSAMAGIVQPHPNASLSIDGMGMAHAPTHALVEAGLALVPDGRGIFGELSVRENLLLGAFAKRARDGVDQRLNDMFSLFPRLQERQAQMVRTMSGGEQQMVAIGRALMSQPRVLMLDEPSLGLSPLLSKEVFKTLRRIADTGVGILVVEQNARLSLAVSDRGYLLENGQISGALPAQQMLNDPTIQQAYLGGQKSKTPAARSFVAAASLSTVAQASTPFQVGIPAVASGVPHNLHTMIQIAADRSEQTVALKAPQWANHPVGNQPAVDVAKPAHDIAPDFKASIDIIVQRALSRDGGAVAEHGAPLPILRHEAVTSQPSRRRVHGLKPSLIEIYRRNSAGEMVKE
jgi:branched-chain amino acid transport system ATP-binding protein